jgi:hypothetical protein
MRRMASLNSKWVHFVSATCRGEECVMCDLPATHKIGEEIPPDDPSRENTGTFPMSGRHNLTAYLCCYHFTEVLGPATACGSEGA